MNGSYAGTNLTHIAPIIESLSADETAPVEEIKDRLRFYKQELEQLWQQHGHLAANIKGAAGNHAELEADYAYFSKLYQQDIQKGQNVENAKKALKELKEVYSRKHAIRYEKEQAQLHTLALQMKKELQKKSKELEKFKKKNAKAMTAGTRSMATALETALDQSFARLDAMKSTAEKQGSLYAKR